MVGTVSTVALVVAQGRLLHVVYVVTEAAAWGLLNETSRAHPVCTL